MRRIALDAELSARLASSGIAFDYDATSSLSLGTLEDPDGNGVTIVPAKDRFAPLAAP